jgi:CheY-like chemotaxis protein
MVALIVIFTVIVFIVVDLVLRIVMKKVHEAKMKKDRESALDIGLRLDYTDEAISLKRVQVEFPKAAILAVDDEAIVLDSFRKILVLEGYSIDTVETGKEALGLIQKNDYDFVFTDLKMPEMDGLDVVKAVKHLRPDIDVIMITGYATIESAVDSMKYGAMDYVQKPFTEEELINFTNKSLIRRMARIEKQIRPAVHLVTPSTGVSTSKHEFNVPAGIFISPAHTWINIELNGMARVGIDDFAQKLIGKIDGIDLPRIGQKVRKGEPIFAIKLGSRSIEIPSPLSGTVAGVNIDLPEHVEYIQMKPYELGWIFHIEPTSLPQELQSLRIGADAVSWYQQEIDKFSEIMKKISTEKRGVEASTEGKGITEKEQQDDQVLEAFSKSFLRD